jgi:hypothetical protein
MHKVRTTDESRDHDQEAGSVSAEMTQNSFAQDLCASRRDQRIKHVLFDTENLVTWSKRADSTTVKVPMNHKQRFCSRFRTIQCGLVTALNPMMSSLQANLLAN